MLNGVNKIANIRIRTSVKSLLQIKFFLIDWFSKLSNMNRTYDSIEN